MAGDLDRYIRRQRDLIRDKRWSEEMIDRGSYCIICGRQTDPRVVEKHHVAGRRNDDQTITVCPTCHAHLSLKQRSWPEWWTRDDNPPLLRAILLLLGLRDIIDLMSHNIDEAMDGSKGAGDGDH